MAMYEQDEAPGFRRGLWLVLWFVVIVAVLWVVVWLLFFRETKPEVSTLHGSNTKQSQSNGNSKNSGSSNGGQQGSNKNTGSSSGAGSTGNSNTNSADQLANAGAGNIFVPFAVATAAGTVLYYVRLRKKLLS